MSQTGNHTAAPGHALETGVADRRIFVVLPAYNEAANLGSVLASLGTASIDAEMKYQAVVVNDGSTDGTGEVVRKHKGPLPVTLIEHPCNQGLGAAIRTGLLSAVDFARDEDIIVTMDADDTHTASTIGAMVARIDGGCDVVIASRYQPGAEVIGVPPVRRFLSYAASLLFRTVFPIRGVRDFTCGYRAYRAVVLRNATLRYRSEFINQEGFQCMVDILLKLSRLDLRFGEVPLVLRYDRKGGKSKMRVVRTILKTLELLVKRRMGF
jgi:dolichol-phosphate mannosyltransferase